MPIHWEHVASDIDDDAHNELEGNQDDIPSEEACKETCLEPHQENTTLEVVEDFHCCCLHALQSYSRRCASLQDCENPL